MFKPSHLRVVMSRGGAGAAVFLNRKHLGIGVHHTIVGIGADLDDFRFLFRLFLELFQTISAKKIIDWIIDWMNELNGELDKDVNE